MMTKQQAAERCAWNGAVATWMLTYFPRRDLSGGQSLSRHRAANIPRAERRRPLARRTPTHRRRRAPRRRTTYENRWPPSDSVDEALRELERERTPRLHATRLADAPIQLYDWEWIDSYTWPSPTGSNDRTVAAFALHEPSNN